MQSGCVPGTVFETSDNGWITQDIYLKWFKFFVKSIPPARPVLLIEDGHSSHITLDVIELARKNDIYLLCLPSHSSHILQPLDIGVFKSFKTHYPKACRKYIVNNPGRVITSEVIALLVCDAWAHSITPVNILGGFKKTGISPFNPSAVDDRMLAPAKVFKPTNDDSSSYTRNTSFSTEQHSLFEKRFNEEYDVQDPLYELWLKEQHPESDTDSMKTHANSLSTMSSNESSVVLKYPEVKVSAKRRGKPAANSTSSVCLSDSPAMKQLKQKEEEKRLAEEEKARKKEEREVKKAERERKKVLREKEREEKKKEREEKKKERDRKRLAKEQMKTPRVNVSDDDDEEVSQDEVECPICHVKEGESSCQCICCDNCDIWYHTHCTDINQDDLPDIFYCLKCV